MIRSKYNKRTRKRLRIGEYRQFGFQLVVFARNDDSVLDSILTIIHAEGLKCSGGGYAYYIFFVSSQGQKYDPNMADKSKIIKDKILKLSAVNSVKISDLVDVWHMNEDDMIHFDEWMESHENKLGQSD